MKRRLFFLAFLFWQQVSAQQLNGKWTFALDPVKVGEQDQWYSPGFASGQFDAVTIPHCFSADPRYLFYTGTAWYFKTFAAPPARPGYRTFLQFGAVFYKTKVWLNGQLAATHEGGYTPFEADITEHLKDSNVLAVSVDNAWDTTTIPGAKTAVTYTGAHNAQQYPWLNYGGIVRPVQLVVRPAVYLLRVKAEPDPDLKKGAARIRLTAYVRNLSTAPVQPPVDATIYYPGNSYQLRLSATAAAIAPGGTGKVVMEGALPAKAVKLWHPDAPHLYTAQVITGTDTLTIHFGIRKLELKGTQLLLNGSPVRMGGGNRPADAPGYGSIDPDSILQHDLALMKSAGMELSRIAHYPVTEHLLDWADRHGMLIITEAGNWQMTPKQMADTAMRAKFRAQLREMVERDWNHPSVIAYSLGNEFQSQTPEGIAWVKDMGRFVKTLDSTRFTTFASYIVWRDYIRRPTDEASNYVDFISTNIYGNHLKLLQRIHALYPDKAVYISEFGLRASPGNEAARIAYLKQAMQDFRQCDYLIGASVWTFNDYRSRFPGTDPDGYRAWGLVSPQRELRGMYHTWQEEFAPATIKAVKQEAGQLTLQITARPNFPSYTLHNYELVCGSHRVKLNTLAPGESQQVAVPATADAEVALIKPGGFVCLKKTVSSLTDAENR